MRLRALCVLLAAATASLGCSRPEPEPLNVLLITLDTTRADRLGSYGSRSGATPALDSLASRAIRFDQAWSVAPLTLPAHATILTGLLPQKHGLRVNGGGTLPGSVETLATGFQRSGYRTGAFVSAFVLDRRFGLARGFDVYDDAVDRDPAGGDVELEAERPASRTADAALAWLGGASTSPFFAWVHFYDPHAPYASPEPFASRFAAAPYDGELAYMDSQVARLVQFLERVGVRGRTVIAVAGDHGEGLGEHGEAAHGLLLYESTLRVPLLLESPRLKPRVVRTPVSLADLAPTIRSLAGIKGGGTTADGRDLSADLIGGREPAVRDVYAESHYARTFGWHPLVALRRGARKLISGAHDELFDLERDPKETRNTMADDRRAYREILATLSSMRGADTVAAPVDDETRAKLASLGYVAPSSSPTAANADPRAMTAAFRDFESAAAKLRKGDVTGAIALLEPLVKADSRNRPFRSMLGRALASRGDRAAALRLYRESVAIDPASADAWFELAAALQDGGDPRETKAAVEEALRLDPRRAEGHNMMGVALSAEEEHAAAADAFRRAIAIDPRNARAWNNLGNALRALGNLPEALEAYGRASALAPRNPDPLNGHGVTLVLQNRAGESVAYFDRALAIAPDYHEARLNRAVAFATMGDKRAARAQLRDLLARLPKGREWERQREAARALLASSE